VKTGSLHEWLKGLINGTSGNVLETGSLGVPQDAGIATSNVLLADGTVKATGAFDVDSQGVNNAGTITGASITDTQISDWTTADGLYDALGSAAAAEAAANGYTDTAVASYLPLAGGTMTGLVTDFGANLKVVTVPNFTATPHNDWNPAGLSTAGALSVCTDGVIGNVTITGVTAQAEGRMIVLENRDTSYNIILSHSDAGSAANNRFLWAGGANITIRPYGAVMLMYLNARWRCLGTYV
jgi:hypothetical protein